MAKKSSIAKLSPEALRAAPGTFLETGEFDEMLESYRSAAQLAQTDPQGLRALLAERDFADIYPVMDAFAKARNLRSAEDWAALSGDTAAETAAFAATLLDMFTAAAETRYETEYDIVGNSPATYFICGVWANMKRGREFHPASRGITVTYSKPDAYGNQNISYRNKDYEMTLIFEAVEAYTRKLSWTAHRLLVYTLTQGNLQNWRNNAATFNIKDYMLWAGLSSRDAAYRQLKNDVQAITGVKLTAESFKKYFESFYTTHLAVEAEIKKYTGEIRIAFAENVRHFLTQYYQLIPDWMGQLGENAYRLAFYLFYRARKDSRAVDGSFGVNIEDIVKYIGLPTKAEVRNRNYDEAIMKPFHRAVEEIAAVSHGSFTMSFACENINAFLAGQMTVGVDATMQEYLQKLDKARTAKKLEAEKKTAGRRKKSAVLEIPALPVDAES